MNTPVFLLFAFVFLIVVAAIISMLVLLLVQWLNRPQRVLSFFKLSEEEQESYMNLYNQIDTQIGARFARKLPLTVGMAILTGGTSLFFAGARQAYELGKQGSQITRVKDYVERERIAYGCKYINWNTFPGAHIVIGGEPRRSGGQKMRCPICKKIDMQQFSAEIGTEIYFCYSCSKSMAMSRSSVGIPKELYIPGLCVGAIPIAGELHDIALDLGGSLFDGAGMLLDLLG